MEIKNIKWDPTPPPNIGLRASFELHASAQEQYWRLAYNVTLNLANVEVGTVAQLLTGGIDANSPAKLSVKFGMTPFLFQTIEGARAGRDLPWALDVQVLVVNQVKNRPVGPSDFSSSGALVPKDQKFSRDDWSGYIDTMGLRSFAVVELRRPPKDSTGKMDKVEARITEAQKLLERGETDKVVVECRNALQELNPLVIDPPGDLPTKAGAKLKAAVVALLDAGSQGQDGSDMKSDRVFNMHRDLVRFVHQGPHTPHYHITHNDAVYALWETAILVGYYSAVLNGP
jgi:hypothetical protein